MKTRHVILKPPLDVGQPTEGYVLAWRQTQRLASPPMWEAYVVSVDERRGTTKVEWVPAVYLEPVVSARPENDE